MTSQDLSMTSYEIRPVGHVESPLTDRATAPKQGVEGAPPAWLVFRPDVADAARDLAVGDELWVLTWLHRSDRTVLRVHPRGDPRRTLTGVISTSTPYRPNPALLPLLPVT